jgi:hypothetical protein
MIMLFDYQKRHLISEASAALKAHHEAYPCMPEEIDMAYMMLQVVGLSQDEIKAVMVQAGIEKAYTPKE